MEVRLGSTANFTGHVISTTHGRLDLAMSVRALGDGNLGAGACRDRFVYQFFATVTTGHCAYAHATFLAGVCCHRRFLI